MNVKSIHAVNPLATLAVVAGLSAWFATAGVAQSVGGQAYGTYVNTPAASLGQSPLAVLPAISGTDGDIAFAEADASGVPGTLSTEFLNSTTSGALGTAEAGAQSTATAAAINILEGLITADGLVANVVSSRTASGAASNANGSTLDNLVVAGVPVTSGDAAVDPNTNITLPGVGYVVLNEQIPTGDGVTSSGMTVNMIHVFEQSPILGLLGQIIGYQTVGEIIVGSATSSVGP